MSMTAKTGMFAKSLVVSSLAIVSLALLLNTAHGGTLEGVAIGAGAGAVIAGPPGAVVGGVIGAVTGGPDLRVRRHRHCWINRNGQRRCAWR